MVRILLALALGFIALAVVGGAFGSFRLGGLLEPLQKRGGTRWADHAVGLALACLFVAVVLISAPQLGFMRDEGMYFDASKSYAGWFERLLSNDPAIRKSAFEKAVVDAHWTAKKRRSDTRKIR